jgi:hypothetical protein
MPGTNDAFLWYNVGDWAPYGLAVPNWSDDSKSNNQTVRNLVEVAGRNVQAIMWHPDAQSRTPPSINTLIRIHKLCLRVRTILSGRAIDPGTPNMETKHAQPTPEEFLVFPTPYFQVRNSWLKQYAGLMLTALIEAMQHSENSKAFEISLDFAGQVGQYPQRVYRMMATELFGVPSEAAAALDFTLSDEQLRAYKPSSFFTSTEMIDVVPPLDMQPTEDTLKVLTDGIPISQLPVLTAWPNGPAATGKSGSAASSGAFVAPPSP